MQAMVNLRNGNGRQEEQILQELAAAQYWR
jgi:hypothetical protein